MHKIIFLCLFLFFIAGCGEARVTVTDTDTVTAILSPTKDTPKSEVGSEKFPETSPFVAAIMVLMLVVILVILRVSGFFSIVQKSIREPWE